MFCEWHLGFRTGTKTKTAIVRHIHSVRTIKITAVIDLKFAYDSVPTKKLYKLVMVSQSDQLTRVILLSLQPVSETTQGDRSGTTEKMANEVCLGSPLSFTLFYIYTDTMPMRLN